MARVPIPPSANFSRYPYRLSDLLGQIRSALALIKDAPVLPAAEDELRASAKVGTIHFSTLIEGNELPLIEAERAANRTLERESKAKIELVNYVDALDLLDQRLASNSLATTPDLVLDLHRETTKDLGEETSDHFKPRHVGAWRDGRALVVDHVTGQVMHEGPPSGEVPERMQGLCDWLNERESRLSEFPPPVLAGVAHYNVTDIHPFADGNGRVARLFTVAVLMKHGYLPGRLFSFERYYAEDRPAYYEALRSVRANTFNLESWLEYFLRGLALEYERVADRIRELNRFGLRRDAQVQLTASQQRGLAVLAVEQLREFARHDYERAAGVSERRAQNDLRGLTSIGMVRPVGSGPSTRYRLSRPRTERNDSRGRKRNWTEDRIERELRDFLAALPSTGWPKVDDFRDAGRYSLYRAAARYGGIEHWRARLGR
jgi:Fic family protein